MSTSLTDPRAIVSLHLGRMDYDRAWALQRRVQQRLIDAKLSTPPALLPNVLLTVEHPPVFTIGKSGDAAHLLASQTELSNQGATFVETDRGGDITFHGPGQLVGYPILDLDHFFADIGRYLRTLESVIIRTCESYGINAGRVAKRTGVWVDSGSPEERKICAMGIRCSRWVTMHGFALNMNTELEFYDSIIPCGISDREVTSIARELGQSVDEDECRERVVGFFGESFGTTITKADSLEKLFERLSNAET